MKTINKTIILTIGISAILASLGYGINFGSNTLDVIPSDKLDRYPDCELVIFSGDDGVCLKENQVDNLDWLSIDSCDKSGKKIQCGPNVYPTIHAITAIECAILFDESLSAWTTHAKEAQSSGVQWEPPTKQGIISGSEFFAQFRETDCRYFVNDWAHLIQNQDLVWDGIPWPNLRNYPHEHLNIGDAMVLEAFPKSNPLKGDHYLHQIEPGEYQYLWNAIMHGNVILSPDDADQFFSEFADKSTKFEMHMSDGTTQIWRMTYAEKNMQDGKHQVEAIVFASDIPGDAPHMPYVQIPDDMIPIITPLTEREKQFHYQEISTDDAEKIYKMLDANGIMFTMNDEKLFLKYLGPFLESTN